MRVGMTRPLGKLEGLMLILIGLSVGWFALFGEYHLLMNPRFMYLTVGGATLVLLIGVAGLGSRHQRLNYTGVTVFGLFVALVVFGRPYATNEYASKKIFEPDMKRPPSILDGIEYKNMDMVKLYLSIGEEDIPKQGFVTTGVVKRLPELDRAGQFALMKTMMVCCLADAMALGVRVSYENTPDLKDGEWVNVYGRLRKTPSPMKTPSFRFGAVMFTSVSEGYQIEPQKVEPYDPTRTMKTLFAKLSMNNRVSRFVAAVQSVELEQDLKNKGPYTVLAPINEAFDLLPPGTWEELLKPQKKDDLRMFVSNHVIEGWFTEKDMATLASVTSIQGRELRVDVKNGSVFVEGAKIIFADSLAKNGVIHMVYPHVLCDSDK